MIEERLRVILALTDAFEGAAVFDGLLADGYEPVWRSTVADASNEMRAQPFDLLIADEELGNGLQGEGRARNPLTPVILISDSRIVSGSGRAMHLARPVDRAMLTCFVTMALHQDKPVRRSVRKTVDPIAAVVNTVPSYVVDVSPEGLRLEMPGDHRSLLPPIFSVRVPAASLSLTVQRRWTRPASSRGETAWYGGALSQNRLSVEQGWRSFVDTIPIIGQGVSEVSR